MMNIPAEVRAAAERRKRVLAGEDTYDVYQLPLISGGAPWEPAHRAARTDAYILADFAANYLLSLADADDGEQPVTEEWLRSVGFDAHNHLRWWLEVSGKGIRLGMWLENGGVRMNGEDTDLKLPIRGDVRALAACLKIELTEPKICET